MKFLIGPNQIILKFKEGLYLNFLKVGIVSIGFGATDPGIVTVQRIVRAF
jgi:hypothetical protein